MGTTIQATSISANNKCSSSLDHSTLASEQCITAAGIEKCDIDLLINIGIFRDDNINEPAIATLIQNRLGLNMDSINGKQAKTTFSFDLMNGACGFLYAGQVVDALFKNDANKQALIVSSDVHPSNNLTPDFPYSQMGAAAILGQSQKAHRGFESFYFNTSNDGYEGAGSYCDVLTGGSQSRNCVTIDMQHDFHSRLQQYAVLTIEKFLKSHQTAVAEISLLIISQPEAGFAHAVAESIGFERSAVIDVWSSYGNPHTSGLSIGYHMAAAKGLIGEGDRILFVGAGSGLTAACGLYVV